MEKYLLGKEYEEDTNAVYNVWFVVNDFKGYELTDEQYDLGFQVIGKEFGTMDGTVYYETISSDYEDESFTEADWAE